MSMQKISYQSCLKTGLLKLSTSCVTYQCSPLLLFKSAFSEKDTVEENENTLQNEVYGAEKNCFQYI